MVAQHGRAQTIDIDLTGSEAELAGVMESTVTINNELIDITSNDDSGWTTLMSLPGVRNVSLSGTGVAKDNSLLSKAMSASSISGTGTVTLAHGGTLTGTWAISEVELSASHDEYVEFSATLESSGAVAYTPPA